MTWIRRLSSTAALATALAAATAVLAVAGWNLHAAKHQAHAAAAQVTHSQEVLRAVATFREAVAALSAGQRGYLLTGSPAFAAERDEAIARAEVAALQLQALLADDPRRQQLARELSAALADRVAAARERAQQHARQGRAWAPELPTRSHDAALHLRELASQLEDTEAALLAQRQRVELQRQRDQTLVVAASLAAFAAILLVAGTALFVESRRRRRSEQQMAEILDNLPVTVWQMVTGRDGVRRFIYVGSAARRERGFDADQLMEDAQVALQNVLPQDRAQLLAAFDAAERSMTPLDCHYRVELAQGRLHWLHNHASMRRRADGTVLWTGYWADITARKKLEEDLREATEAAESANRAKSTFLATMSHEIRTPLNGVLGLLELLSLSGLDRDQRATLGVVRESGRSLLRIIDDILDFSKVEAGRLSLEPVPASLRDTITRACQVHSGIASSRGLLLEHSLDPRLSPALLFDPLRLGQILNNFISNALKFTHEGSVRVAADLVEGDARGQRVRITVTDTGIGVSPDMVARLFEPFVQAQQPTGTYGGTGLGLAISRRLAALMGGDVRMDSTAGRGTQLTLEVHFPLADPADVVPAGSESAQRRLTHAIAARRFAPAPAAAEEEGTLVLVVDDHPTNRLVLSRQVTALGYGVLTADDGADAFAQWQSRRIALILTDCNMPNMNGYELAQAVRREEARTGAGRMPILGCTANALSTEAARCAAAGMDDCLIKPIDLIELMERMELWLPLAGEAASPGTPAAATPDVFDPSLLVVISGGDAEVEREVLEGFLQTNRADMASLEAAVAAADLAEVARMVHRMAGAAQTLGAQAVLRACQRLEGLAQEGDHAGLALVMQDLQAGVKVLEGVLEDRMRLRPPLQPPWSSAAPAGPAPAGLRTLPR